MSRSAATTEASACSWTCRSCVESEAGCNLPADLGLWSDPPHPDAICSECREYPPEPVRLRVAMQRARATPGGVAADSAATNRRRRTAAILVSARTAAARLGIGRDKLAMLVDAGVIERVPKGNRGQWAYRAEDVERLGREGFSLPPSDGAVASTRRTKAPRKPRAKRAPAALLPASIADLPF